MVRNGKLKFLGMSAFTGMLAVWSSLAGCQGDSTTSTSGDTNAGGSGGTGSAVTTGSNTGGDTSVTSGSMTTTGSSTGTGGSTAQVATITAITTGAVGPGIEVQLKGVVAMSQKFLVSKGGSGSCLWGIFVSEPNLTETKENSGILVVSYGTNASIKGDGGMAYCPVLGVDPAGDAFPDTTVPGDVLDVTGETAYFLLSQCATAVNGSTVAQFQLSKVKPGNAVKTGTAPVPAAHKLTVAEYAKLSSPNDKDFHDKWGGVKVEVAGVVAEPQTVNGITQLLDANGNMYVHDATNANPTAADTIKVADKLYYSGYLKPNDFCHDGPKYADPATTFTAIAGIQYLNYCTWDMEPGNKCSDLSPPSPDAKDCNSKSDACP